MPGQEFGTWFKLGIWGHVDFLPVKYLVLIAIVELFLDTVADFKTTVGCDRDIPGIEKPMDVGPE